MKRLFIDSSVMYSAVYSARGYSRDLILMAIRGDIDLVLSDLVMHEVRRNLLKSAPEIVDLFDYLLILIPYQTVNPDREEVELVAKYVALKDAPILAAARKAGVDMLVMLDQKHFLGKPELAEYAQVQIVTPREAVAKILQG